MGLGFNWKDGNLFIVETLPLWGAIKSVFEASMKKRLKVEDARV
jgi:hypothetical protein